MKNTNVSLGISLSVIEVVCTISIASLVKLIAGDLSVFMVLFFRYLFCIPLLLITALYQRKKRAFLIVSKSGLGIRTITGLGSFGCLFAALQFIDLSLMTTLFQTMPIFITLLAPFIIKEVVGWFRRTVALIGFIGVLFILDPFSENWLSFGVILGILSPIFGALMTLSVRNLGKTDHPTSTALWYNIFGASFFLFICVFNQVQWPQYNDILLILLIIGLVSSFQQICLAYSLKLAPASLLAPLRYIAVPFGILTGVYFFNEQLSPTFLIGTTIVIMSSLIIIKREAKIKLKT
ncbi:DMT family transporter [Alphaproteobacteria bacterium]|nr:DMT family transporter [Alphaproteobacteria bacterium]